MRRICICAFLAGAFYGPVCLSAALAQPLPTNLNVYGQVQSAPVQNAPVQNPPATTAQHAAPAGRGLLTDPHLHYAQAAPQPGMGGGFIQFLFAGAAPQQQVPRPYQPQQASPQPQQVYQQPQPAYQQPQQVYQQPQQVYQPQQAGQAQQYVVYQRAPDFYQQAPVGYPQQPQPVVITVPPQQLPQTQQQQPLMASVPAQTYAPSGHGDMTHPAADPKFDRQVVNYEGNQEPGTIIIDTPKRFLFLVEGNGKAMRYGIGVGRPGFTWAGEKSITAKREWPDWHPPIEMIERRPDLPRFMAGGPDNPLGARAMYLGSTLYRIHGSNEPWTIGTNVSSGCIRMRNEDVIDLYDRVKVGTKVLVI
jgi:lipoprotein-anchoring transpeptidase ErfK/SrfK